MSVSSGYCRIKQARVREILDEKELKRWWVAEVAGIHKTTLRRWLSGRIDRVREENAERLARVLAIPHREIAEPIMQ